MGVECESPEAGCCGMAGSFGFERGDHYDVSIACGERELLPAVRDADVSRSSLLTASVVTNRSRRGPAAAPSIWLR